MNKLIKIGVLALLSSFASLQAAEFESNVALSSEYMWRGTPQSDGNAAISGGFDISTESGFYFGTWGSNVEYGDDATMELDWYAGFAGETEAGLSYDIGYLLYDFPGADYDLKEIYLGLGYSFFGVTYYAGQSDADDNLELSFALGETGLSLTYGDYDDLGDYTILSYDLPMTIAGLSINLGWHSGDYEGVYDDDQFVITFSM